MSDEVQVPVDGSTAAPTATTPVAPQHLLDPAPLPLWADADKVVATYGASALSAPTTPTAEGTPTDPPVTPVQETPAPEVHNA